MLAHAAMNFVAPKTEAETVEAVNAVRSARQKIAIRGGGTRAGLGRAGRGRNAAFDARPYRASRSTSHRSLYISARAGTPLSEIETALKEKNQTLPFEPMDHRALYGTSGEPTIGGIAACNISGPRRISAGAARDLLIGLRFVNGRGEIVKTGGRVMKNVTGLDLVKLLCGGHGTLGIITEATFKVLPHPRVRRDISALWAGGWRSRCRTLRRAGHAAQHKRRCASAGRACDAGAAHIVSSRRAASPPSMSASRRCGEPSRRSKSGEALAPDYAGALWRAICNVVPLVSPPDAAIWRVSIQPTRAPKFVDLVLRQLPGALLLRLGRRPRLVIDCSGGRCGGAIIRGALKEAGNGQTIGHGIFGPRAGRCSQPRQCLRAAFAAAAQTDERH
ncbi:MAG: FAD-binding protein [Methylovirgula sp.]